MTRCAASRRRHGKHQRAAEVLGPFYDTAGLQAWWGVSRQAINQRVKDGKLVAVPTDDRPRRILYPAWLFRPDGSIVPGVAQALVALSAAGWDPITTAAWFIGPGEDLEGLSPSRWLTEGRPAQDVVASAHRDVSLWLR